VQGGAQAAGRASGAIEAGKLADLLALNGQAPDLTGREGDVILDSYIFAGDDRMITDLWSAGRHLVTQGRHIGREAITAAYGQTVQKLRSA
jgi:formimidoylglutamate deiminase